MQPDRNSFLLLFGHAVFFYNNLLYSIFWRDSSQPDLDFRILVFSSLDLTKACDIAL